MDEIASLISDPSRWFAPCAAAAILAAAAPAARAEQVRRIVEQRLPDVAGKSFTAVEVDFAPGSKGEPHSHGQAFVFAYVVSGAVRSQLAGEPAKIYRAGQSWFEPPGARHLLSENLSRTAPARLLAVFVADSGAPLKTALGQKAPKVMPAIVDRPAAVTVPPAPAPQQMVDALYSAFGDHHSRAVHAKGLMVVGSFEPSPEAAGLSAASIFVRGRLPVLARFSDFTGIPTIPDTVGDANPRGFAVKFKLPDGSSADVVSHSFNGFPTATAAEFRELLLAIGASGAGASRPTALDGFLATHPIAKTFLTTQKPPPESYATLSYFGVNAFAFTNRAGQRHVVRYRFTREAGEAVLTPAVLATKGPDYLQAELPARLKQGPVAFTWYAQIAESSDAVGDPSVAWPESRKLVKLGVIRFDAMAPDPQAAEKQTLFRPLNVPAGIEPADPMLGVRHAAYPLSFQHRQ